MTLPRSSEWKSEQPGFSLLQLNEDVMSMLESVVSVIEDSILRDRDWAEVIGVCGETAYVTCVLGGWKSSLS